MATTAANFRRWLYHRVCVVCSNSRPETMVTWKGAGRRRLYGQSRLGGLYVFFNLNVTKPIQIELSRPPLEMMRAPSGENPAIPPEFV